MSQKTISTHAGGGEANRLHNIRSEKVLAKLTNVNLELSKFNEYLIDVPPRKAYAEIFGDSVKVYNEKMMSGKKKRPERCIDDYYRKVENDKQLHTVYEMIIQIGDKKSTGVIYENTLTEREIIKEFIATWPERNPNMKLIGAYIHADEPDGTLHAHLDYIPVAYNCSRGLTTQNSLRQAIKQMGYSDAEEIIEKDGKQITKTSSGNKSWTRAQNDYLDALCRSRGIKVIHPMRDTKDMKRAHMSTTEYKKYAVKIDEQKDELNKLQQENEIARETAHYLQTDTTRLQNVLEQLRTDNESLNADNNSLEKKKSEIVQDLLSLDKELEQKRQLSVRLNEEIAKFSDVAKRIEITDEHTPKKILGIIPRRKIKVKADFHKELIDTYVQYGVLQEKIAQKEERWQQFNNELLSNFKQYASKNEKTVEELAKTRSELNAMEKSNKELISVDLKQTTKIKELTRQLEEVCTQLSKHEGGNQMVIIKNKTILFNDVSRAAKEQQCRQLPDQLLETAVADYQAALSRELSLSKDSGARQDNQKPSRPQSRGWGR